MRTKALFISLYIMGMLPAIAWAQDDTNSQSKTPAKSAKEAVKKLSVSLEESVSDMDIANNYVVLAKELYAQGDYAKAEGNLKQAILLYNRSKEQELHAETLRELARTQEMQQKFEEAIASFENAARITRKKEFKEINQNDANRLKNRSNPEIQSSYVQRNIDISNTVQKKEIAVEAHQQMAKIKMEHFNDADGAVEELESALTIVEEENLEEEALKIKQVIAQTYIADEEYEKAIDLNESLVAETQKISNPQAEIGQLKNLAHTYFEAKDEQKGIQVLEQAYRLAMDSHRTMEARNTLRELTNYYKEKNDIRAALSVYNDFIYRLDTLIKADSTLIEEKFFQLHEERIKRLENERALKDELIARTSRFNYVLLGAIILILISLGLIVKSLFSINKKNKKIALQSLRREMNPHFIFNSLNSVNQFIAQNNELEANKYLSSYSRLMRNVMENSNKDFITLTTELEQLREYMELEHIRFKDKFTYHIRVDNALDTDATYIPNMVIQPQLENAIWHGLRYKEESGTLALRIEKADNDLVISIEDDGIGIKRSQELKTKHQKQHHSRGLNNTNERIQLLKELYHIPISLHIYEKEGENNAGGVIVTLKLPLINQKP